MSAKEIKKFLANNLRVKLISTIIFICLIIIYMLPDFMATILGTIIAMLTDPFNIAAALCCTILEHFSLFVKLIAKFSPCIFKILLLRTFIGFISGLVIFTIMQFLLSNIFSSIYGNKYFDINYVISGCFIGILFSTIIGSLKDPDGTKASSKAKSLGKYY